MFPIRRGASAIFSRWKLLIGSDIEVRALELAGRGKRNIVGLNIQKMEKKKGFKYSSQNELTTIHFQFIDVVGTAAVAKIDFIEDGNVTTLDYIYIFLNLKMVEKLFQKCFTPIPKKY